jgi:hypothetical protein
LNIKELNSREWTGSLWLMIGDYWWAALNAILTSAIHKIGDFIE